MSRYDDDALLKAAQRYFESRFTSVNQYHTAAVTVPERIGLPERYRSLPEAELAIKTTTYPFKSIIGKGDDGPAAIFDWVVNAVLATGDQNARLFWRETPSLHIEYDHAGGKYCVHVHSRLTSAGPEVDTKLAKAR